MAKPTLTLAQLPPCCAKSERFKKLLPLLTTDLAYSQYMAGTAATRLVATLATTFRNSLSDERWGMDPLLKTCSEPGSRLRYFLACAFDLVTNAEYCRGRLTNDRWIYCSSQAAGGAKLAAKFPARVFYSFLKQCPHCCQTHGLAARIPKSQHKPSSHHIGEITGSVMGMLAILVTRCTEPALNVALVKKQSHDVDALLFSPELAVLLEIKASPMVTYPVAADLAMTLMRDKEGMQEEYGQHSLVTFPYVGQHLYLYIPHRDASIPLGTMAGATWPYQPLTDYFRSVDNFLPFMSAWLELFLAYRIPKKRRVGRETRLAYLTNGWGDVIDSNKTKPGIGRTDDLKKGTYQMLKYGAYYKDECDPSTVYSTLLANLDPVGLRAEYLDKLLDVRWTKEKYVRLLRRKANANMGANAGEFGESEKRDYVAVPIRRLYHLYESILAFNNPLQNEPRLGLLWDFARAETAINEGTLDDFLAAWNTP